MVSPRHLAELLALSYGRGHLNGLRRARQGRPTRARGSLKAFGAGLGCLRLMGTPAADSRPYDPSAAQPAAEPLQNRLPMQRFGFFLTAFGGAAGLIVSVRSSTLSVGRYVLGPAGYTLYRPLFSTQAGSARRCRAGRVGRAPAQLGPASHARAVRCARGGAGKCCSTGPRPRHAWGRAACCPWWATACALDPLHARWGGSTLSGAAPLTLHCRHGRPSKRQHRLRACHEVSVMAAWTAGGGGSVSDTCFFRN